MDYEMETDYQQDYIAQPEQNQEEYQQIQYLYNMLYQVLYIQARRRENFEIISLIISDSDDATI